MNKVIVRIRWPLVTALLAVLWLPLGGMKDRSAVAQPQRRGAQFIEDMVNVLIESQSRSDPSGRIEPSPDRNLPDRNLPDGDVSARQPQASSSRDASSRHGAPMRELRANVTGFAQSVSQLVSQLYQDINRTPGLRAIMGEALQVNAQATVLARMASDRLDVQSIAAEFSQVDIRWRNVAFQLKQLRYLTNEARQQIQQVDEFHARVSRSLQVRPQADREAVIRAANLLATELVRLMEEIDVDVTDANLRRSLLLDGRSVYQQARHISSLATRSPRLAEVQREYQRYDNMWSPLARRLRDLGRLHLDRQLRRVQASQRTLQEELLLEPEVDRAELQHLAELLHRELDHLMDNITLRQLAELTRGRDRIVGYSADFYSACGDFADCVRNGESMETMADVYEYLDDNWANVAGILRQAEASEAQQVYGHLDRLISDIRDMLSVQPRMDNSQAIQVAARLQSLADHLEGDLRSALAAHPNRYSPSYRAQVLRSAEAFRSASMRLSRQLSDGSDGDGRLRDLAIDVSQKWEDLLPLLSQFPNEADRDHFLRIRQQVTPAVVDLQALLAF